ncbi:acyclic terpene utilization AtuA family protein [Chloroflexota bacterium]
MKKVRLGTGSAGWPDFADRAAVSAERGDIDYMACDHLAELTMAILEGQRQKDPKKGYIPEIVDYARQLLPIWKGKEKKFRMISNGGGANPEAAGEVIYDIAKELGIKGFKIGVVTGDDLPLERVDELRAKGLKLTALDTGREDITQEVRDNLIAAYVYVGSERIIEALEQGADMVIGGRFSDNSLFVAPMMYEFGWRYEEPYWDRIGAIVCCAHLLECGGWSTGWCSNLWDRIPEIWNIGYPIMDMDENGDAVITKAPGTGGAVRTWTIKEHLVYEVHDPRNYLMPDGIGDFTALKLDQLGENEVGVTRYQDKPRGKPRPENLKLCLAYRDGYISDYIMTVPGPRAPEKAERAKECFMKRLEMVGIEPMEVLLSTFGLDANAGPAAKRPDCDPNEVAVRFAVKTRTEREGRLAMRQGFFSWSAAGVGPGFGVPSTRPLNALWPTLIPRDEVPLKLTMMEVV